jgi:hypothetical protein
MEAFFTLWGETPAGRVFSPRPSPPRTREAYLAPSPTGSPRGRGEPSSCKAGGTSRRGVFKTRSSYLLWRKQANLHNALLGQNFGVGAQVAFERLFTFDLGEDFLNGQLEAGQHRLGGKHIPLAQHLQRLVHLKHLHHPPLRVYHPHH